MASPFTLHMVELVGFDVNPDVVIQGIVDQGINTTVQEVMESASSEVEPRWVSAKSQEPRITFSSIDVKTVIETLGSAQYQTLSAAGPTYSGARLWWRRRAPGGVFDATASWIKMEIFAGIIVPQSIQAAHDGTAVIGLEIVPIASGANAPIVVTANVASPALAFADITIFTVGPWFLNGDQLDGMNSFSLNFNNQVDVIRSQSEVWPTHCHLASSSPVLTGESQNVDELDETAGAIDGILGEAYASDTYAYLQARLEGAGLELPASLKHIKFSITQGRYHTAASRGRHNDTAMMTVQITPAYDGLNRPFVIAVDQAIA